MVFAGTQTIAGGHFRKIEITTVGLDADAEYGAAVDLHTHFVGQPLPDKFNLQVTRTAGTVTAISVALQGSMDGVVYEAICTAVLKDTLMGNTVNYAAAVQPRKQYRYLRNYATTVGAGNTHTAVAWASR